MRQPFEEAVKVADEAGTRIDYASVIDELDVLLAWAKMTKSATSIVEKIHKSNKDVSNALGTSKPRDVLHMQSGFVLRRLMTNWGKRTGRAVPRRKDSAEFKSLLREGLKQSRGRNVREGHPGHLKFHWLNMKRKAIV